MSGLFVKIWFSIRSKLMILLIISGIGGALTISVLSYISADTALRNSTWDQLIATRETKKGCLTRSVDQQFRLFRIFAGEEQLPAAFEAFRAGFKDKDVDLKPEQEHKLVDYYKRDFLPHLPKSEANNSLNDYLPTTKAGANLQLNYIVENPQPVGKKDLLEARGDTLFSTAAVDAYDEAHRKYHAMFMRMMTEMNMYDLFLVDQRTGDILYTVQKEADFGTNLEHGPYRNSVLAKAFRKARDGNVGERGVVMADFERYEASFGAPSAFLAAPVLLDGDIKGVVVGQISIDALNDAMTASGHWASEGLGASGEVYLVGPDMTARTDSRFMIENREGYLKSLAEMGVAPAIIESISSSGHSILNQKIITAATTQALAGVSGTDILPDYRNIEVLSAYSPIDVGGMRWAIIAEKDVSEALGPLFDLRRNILIATGVVSILLTLFALLSARVFLGPIARLQAGVERLKAGELKFEIDASGSDEFAALGGAFNGMVSEIARRNQTIELKTVEYENLLRNVLPDAVADRFSGGELMVADTFENVSIAYAAIGGLHHVMKGVSAGEMIRLLNELIDRFDDAAERNGVEKIKTVGDAYLAACGLSTPRLDHRQRIKAFADELELIIKRFNEAKGYQLTVQIGLANGDVDAGIVGKKRFVYELLGECVVDARRLALGVNAPGIHMSHDFAAAITPVAGVESASVGSQTSLDDKKVSG